MQLVRRIVPFVTVVALSSVVAPVTARAVCSGDCGSELAASPKTIEKFVKARWKAVAACTKKGTPACPTACPLPDGTAEPYLLSASCAGLITCHLDALVETAYDTSWDDVVGCASAPASTCGNARGANAGKLVSTKLNRRRSSKMSSFPKDVAKCIAKITKVPACSGDLCNDAAAWIDEIFPLGVGPGGSQILPFTVATPGEGVATLSIATVGTDWGLAESESVVVTYDLDGTPRGQLVLYGGAEPTTYRAMLGPLTAGNHVLGLKSEKKLSPAAKAPITVLAAASVEAIAPPDARYDFMRFAPILLGIDQDLNVVPSAPGSHPGNAVSDTPLIVYASSFPGGGFTTYRYVVIWSNEDGGTGQFPDLLIARYGRTTDIEGIAEVDVSNTGVLLDVRFRPDESGMLADFDGSFIDEHPVLRTATANGLIADDGASTLAFAIPPFAFDDAGLQRELGMDLDPISYEIMGKEMLRELKTEITANATTKKLSDVRNYLYLDYDIDVSAPDRVLRGVAVVGGVSYYSDHALPFNVATNPRVTDGIGRLAIEVPPGTQIGDIEQYGMEGIGTMSGTLASARAFMLDTDYLPSAPLTYTGPQFQSGTNPSWMVTP